jgi:hypothetical protein
MNDTDQKPYTFPTTSGGWMSLLDVPWLSFTPLPQSELLNRYKWFPTLPIALLDRIRTADEQPNTKRRGQQVMADAAYREEASLFKAVSAWPNGVGVYDGHEYISSLPLQPEESLISRSDSKDQQFKELVAKEYGKSAADVDEISGTLNRRIEHTMPAHAAHGGFLMLQERFHRELSEFHRQLRHEKILDAEDDGMPPMIRLTPRQVDAPDRTMTASESVLKNWGIRGMPQPYIFEFDGPLEGFTADTVSVYRPEAIVVAWPENVGPPSREETRQIIANNRGRSGNERLAVFLDLVAGDTQGKKTLIWFGQLYRIQHYWRALVQRYPAADEGNRRRMLGAVIQYVVGSDNPPEKHQYDKFNQAVKKIENLIAKYPV